MALTRFQQGSFAPGAIQTADLSPNTTTAFATSTDFANFASSLGPKITSVAVANDSFTLLDDTAVSTLGGYIVITGTNFDEGAIVLVDTTSASSVARVNSTTLRVQVPAKSAATYNLFVVNPDGGTGIRVNGITYSTSPTWVTASPLSGQSNNAAFAINLNAPSAVAYSVAAGSTLPTGTTLLANGYFYGAVTISSESTTYSFDVIATDAENQDSSKTFGLTITNKPAQIVVEYLVVAGGGSGGQGRASRWSGGGGGAGGLLTSTLIANTDSTITVIVGNGGPASTSGATSNPEGIGQNSLISGSGIPTTITAFGGGAGGARSDAGYSGGSGGGALNGAGGNGTAGQGYAGAGAAGAPDSGGGGGAGGTSVGSAGYGGIGANNSITGSVVTYAVGGSGAEQQATSGGTGRGGTGSTPSGNGQINTGGGGGGGSRNGNDLGGSGGSGVVILSLPTAYYSANVTGTYTVTEVGSNTVIKFTANGTYTI